MQYYFVLRSVRKAHPHLRRGLSRRRECGIFFLTHPRNAGRGDLRCPFGCREAHRKRSSTRRRVEYCRSPEGRQNGRRRKFPPPGPDGAVCALDGDEAVLPEPIVRHVRMTTSLIEQRAVSLDEVVRMLRRKMRQHSIAGERRIDYIVRNLNAHET